jgi:hypothetical protein
VTDRAAVLVGVSRTGGLPELQAVGAGLAVMERWALDQGMARDAVVMLSDMDGGEVDSAAFFRAVATITADPTLRQLVVYFAGHGVNNGRNEFWLLSGAPANPNEAVNVAASALLAEHCGVPHVVLVSDACRTAPTGIQALNVTGSVIFPNQPPQDPRGQVDQFYACTLGEPAYEIADPREAARAYRSVFTDILGKCLTGQYPAALTPVIEDGTVVDLVRPWPLKRELPGLVMARLRDLGVYLQLSQTPDARIDSDPDKAWISRLTPAADGGQRNATRSTSRTKTGAAAPTDLGSAARDAIIAAAGGRAAPTRRRGSPRRDDGAAPEVDGLLELRSATAVLRPRFGPAHYETRAGFKLRGASLTRVSADPGFEIVNSTLVRAVRPATELATEVLLEFSHGSCVILPALLDYICALTFDGGQLVDVTYEPMDRSARWPLYQERVDKVRELHAAIGAAFRLGVLTSLRPSEVPELAAQVLDVADLDPSLAVYAAYAWHDHGRRDLARDLHQSLLDRLEMSFFDVGLLASLAPGGPVDATRSVPAHPLLTRGWALSAAAPPGAVPTTPTAGSRLPSLWTLFRAEEFDRIRHTLH